MREHEQISESSQKKTNSPSSESPSQARKLFFFKTFFLCVDHLSLYQICYNTASVFTFWLFSHKACGILASQPGIKLTPLRWKAKS